MKSVFEILGMAGIGLSAIAYLPQMTHLVREHCSAGISIRAWRMWLASSLLVGTLALYRHDYVFISLAATSLGSSATILFLARRYRGMGCATNPGSTRQAQSGSTPTPAWGTTMNPHTPTTRNNRLPNEGGHSPDTGVH